MVEIAGVIFNEKQINVTTHNHKSLNGVTSVLETLGFLRLPNKKHCVWSAMNG
jgi:hypothetical protein